MRRVIIAILLLIISSSSIMTILSSMIRIDVYKALLDTVVGSVGAGNFSYWALGHKGALIVELTSISGDADIFVADHNKPSYEPEKHNISSETCGMDVVYIPFDFPRPIGIGIFGHWSHSVSEYSIQVFMDAVASDRPKVTKDKDKDVPGAALTSTSEAYDDYIPIAVERPEGAKPKFLRFLSILETVFEVFIL